MILVTGGDGFVGSRVVARLVEAGAQPRALVRSAKRAAPRLPANGVEIVQGDTTKPETLKPALEGVETVIHTAFITANRKQGPGVNYHETNVVGTQNLIVAARAAGVTRIVEAGGLGTKPDQPHSYMNDRYLADEELRKSGLKWSILGPSVQFGQGSAFIGGLADLIRSAPVVPMVGDGTRKFQPIWVEDVATCLVMMAREDRYDGRFIEVGGPDIYTYAQLLDLLMGAMHTKKLKVPGPTPFVRIGAALMAAALPKPPITPAAVGLFDFDNVTTLDSVERNFGFAPLSFKTYLGEHGV